MFSLIVDLIKTGFALFQKNKNSGVSEIVKKSDSTSTDADTDAKFSEVNQTNREEVRSGFSWRSFLGYVVSLILLYEYIIVPILFHFFGFVALGLPIADVIRIILVLISGTF